MSRKQNIVVEIDERIALATPNGEFQAYCADCGKITGMISTRNAAILLGFSEREIFRLVEAGSVHFVEANDIWICIESMQSLRDIPKQ